MSRRKKKDFARDIGVDERFSSHLVQKMINAVTRKGKKGIATRIVYEAFDKMAKASGGNDKGALDLFEKAFVGVAPVVAVRSKRVGGSVYQIPMEVPERRRQSLALRWIIDSAKARGDKTMGTRLANELIDAAEGRGGAVKKRTDVQRMAEANRAFSHYAW